MLTSLAGCLGVVAPAAAVFSLSSFFTAKSNRSCLPLISVPLRISIALSAFSLLSNSRWAKPRGRPVSLLMEYLRFVIVPTLDVNACQSSSFVTSKGTLPTKSSAGGAVGFRSAEEVTGIAPAVEDSDTASAAGTFSTLVDKNLRELGKYRFDDFILKHDTVDASKGRNNPNDRVRIISLEAAVIDRTNSRRRIMGNSLILFVGLDIYHP